MFREAKVWIPVCAMFLMAAISGKADQLIGNGGFETGSAPPWVVTNSGSGDFFVTSANTGPDSGLATVGPASGTYYALSDQPGPGVHALTQTFTVAPGSTDVILSFDMFVNDWDSGPICGPGLDINSGAVECGRVDILSASAGAFDTGADDLDNLYLGADSLTNNPNPYTAYSFDLTSLLGGGGTFQLRFAEADNQLFFNMGVDNVSLTATPVPEPASVLLLGSLLVLGYRRRALFCKK